MAYNLVSCLAHMACHLLDGIHPSTMQPPMLGDGRTCCWARVAMSGGESCCRVKAAMSGMLSIPPSSAGGRGNMLPGQSYRIWYAQHSTSSAGGRGDMSPGQSCHIWYAQHSTLQCLGMVERQVRAQSGLPCLPCFLIRLPYRQVPIAVPSGLYSSNSA